MLKRVLVIVTVCMLSFGLLTGSVFAGKLDKWKPQFDPSGAKYKCVVSNVSHPVLKGVYAGFAIRDALWERTNGQIYLDYKPFSMLGGEVEVLNQLQMGAIQGMRQFFASRKEVPEGDDFEFEAFFLRFTK